ncbi:MAG: helical backbone metal receptor [Acidobacteriota bacterium]|nr:helical backbone metal receptor [Acidobacteriota bacterium]
MTRRTLRTIRSPASGRRGARPARRDEGEYREYSTDEPRRGTGYIGDQRGNFILVRALRQVCGLVLLTASFAAAQASPTRIVSLVPALTEALFAMGAGHAVVGVSSFDTYPPDVMSRPKVGGLVDPDLERILTLRPGLVVLYGSQADQIAQLRRAGIEVFASTHGGLRETLSVIRTLGTRVRRPDAAAALVTSIEDRLDDIRRRVAGRDRPSVLLVFGREPGTLRNVYASGGVGFLHDMLEAAGGRNVFADMSRESVQLTSEAILRAAPEVILELTYDDLMTPDTQATEIAVWSRLSSIPAVRAGRVFLLLGHQFVQPGPRVAEATAAIATTLHPGPP